jgi:hypothetical protein
MSVVYENDDHHLTLLCLAHYNSNIKPSRKKRFTHFQSTKKAGNGRMSNTDVNKSQTRTKEAPPNLPARQTNTPSAKANKNPSANWPHLIQNSRTTAAPLATFQRIPTICELF